MNFRMPRENWKKKEKKRKYGRDPNYNRRRNKGRSTRREWRNIFRRKNSRSRIKRQA